MRKILVLFMSVAIISLTGSMATCKKTGNKSGANKKHQDKASVELMKFANGFACDDQTIMTIYLDNMKDTWEFITRAIYKQTDNGGMTLEEAIAKGREQVKTYLSKMNKNENETCSAAKPISIKCDDIYTKLANEKGALITFENFKTVETEMGISGQECKSVEVTITRKRTLTSKHSVDEPPKTETIVTTSTDTVYFKKVEENKWLLIIQIHERKTDAIPEKQTPK